MHPSRVPGPFGPKRVADRTPITTECCVFRRGLNIRPREPHKAEECTRTFSEGPVKNRTKNRHAKNHVFYYTKRPSSQIRSKTCGHIFKKRHTSRAKGALYKSDESRPEPARTGHSRLNEPGRAGNGKHVNMESLVSSGTERHKTTQMPPRAAPRRPQRPHPEAPRGPRGSQEPQERPLEPPRPAPRPARHTRNLRIFTMFW